jgi:hypothetical protein
LEEMRVKIMGGRVDYWCEFASQKQFGALD